MTFMNAGFECDYRRVEYCHWWFRGRRDLIGRLVRGLNRDVNAAILDVGCGGGTMLEDLRRAGYGNVFGVDISQSAVDECHARGLMSVQTMDAESIAFGDTQFDLILASDVLEHIERDQMALARWKDVLKPGGAMVVFVPVDHRLWSYHDEVNMHFRRYRLEELITKIERAGLVVERSSYWNLISYIPLLIFGLMERRFGWIVRDRFFVPGCLSGFWSELLLGLLVGENIWLTRVCSLPIGVSGFCVARRRD